MNMRFLIHAIVALMLFSAPAWADNPAPAYWQGRPHTSGDGVMLFNSGQGVTLRDTGQPMSYGPTVTSGGSANAQTLTYTIAPAALVRGQTYSFIAGFTNTGATTLAVNGLTATSIKLNGLALVGGEITSGNVVTVSYDGTNFQLISVPNVYQGQEIFLSGTYAIASNLPFVVPRIGTHYTSVTGTYNASGSTAIWQDAIDSFNVTRAGAGNVSNTRILTTVGGLSQTGGILNLSSVLFVNSTADTTDSFYVADAGQATCEGNVGGSGGSPLGHCVGSNYYARLDSGATNFVEEVGQEIDLHIATGADALYQQGIQVVIESANAVAPTNWGSGYDVAAQVGATPTLLCGFCAGGYNGYNAIASTGALFAFMRHANAGSYPAASVAYGVDLRYVDTTTDAWAGPNSTSLIDDVGTFTSGNGNFRVATNGTLTLGSVTNGAGLQVRGNGSNTDVNLFSVQPSATGVGVTLGCGGPSSDANLNCFFTTNGTGLFAFNTGGGRQLQILDTASAVDFLNITGGASGSNRVLFSTSGTDTDISIQFNPKGAGVLKFGSAAGVSCASGTVNAATVVVSGGLVTHC